MDTIIGLFGIFLFLSVLFLLFYIPIRGIAKEKTIWSDNAIIYVLALLFISLHVIKGFFFISFDWLIYFENVRPLEYKIIIGIIIGYIIVGSIIMRNRRYRAGESKDLQ